MSKSFGERVNQASEWIRHATKLVVFTGAGISTESGLPDYRGPDGVWTRRDRGLYPKPLMKAWHEFAPNSGHLAIVELQKMDKLDLLISQNVDNLHLKSGIRPEKIVELHGNGFLLRCQKCKKTLGKTETGWDDSVHGKGYRTESDVPGRPRCSCGGKLLSTVVNFGDPMPVEETEKAYAHSAACDVFMVVGSSLVVHPAAEMPGVAIDNGAKLILINQGETPYDRTAHLIFRERAGGTLESILKMLRDDCLQK